MFLYTLHSLGAVAIFIAAIPLLFKLLLAAVVVVSLIYHLKQHTRLPQLVWRSGNHWFVNEEQAHCELTKINFFSRWLVILSLSSDRLDATGLTALFRKTRQFVILFDSLDEESFRLLRVRLRIEGFELLNPSEDTTIK